MAILISAKIILCILHTYDLPNVQIPLNIWTKHLIAWLNCYIPPPIYPQTHSISHRRAVLGRRQRFDTLLAEHKSKARDKELQLRLDPSHPAPSLRDPPSSRISQDPHPVSHGNGTADATKPLPQSKPKPHNAGLPRWVASSCPSIYSKPASFWLISQICYRPPVVFCSGG